MSDILILEEWQNVFVRSITVVNGFISFYRAEKNPENLKSAFFLFSEHWKLKDDKLNATQLKHKYEELTQNEKYKWVEKAVKLNPGVSPGIFGFDIRENSF